MRKILGAVALTLTLLLIPAPIAVAAGIVIDKTSGDGSWAGNIWSVDIYPGELRSTTITLYNSSSYSSDVEVTNNPDSLDHGNLTFQLDKSSFSMPGGSYTDLILTVEATGSVTPGLYTTQLEIKSSEVAVSGGGGGGGGGSASYCKYVQAYTTTSGRFIKDIYILSRDNNVRLDISKDTIGLIHGDSLYTICIDKNFNPPATSDNWIVVAAYNISPSDATFDPALVLTWTYDELPDGMRAESLVVAFFDGADWVELDSEIDTESKTVTVYVSHFTTFALISIPETEDEVAEDEEVVEDDKEELGVLDPTTEPEEPVVDEEPAEVDEGEGLPEPEEGADDEMISPTPFNWLWVVLGFLILFLALVPVVLLLRQRRKERLD